MLSLFKTICPQFVEHRWEYLYETLEWIAPRQSALEFLKLKDFANAADERDNPAQNEQHQLSSKQLELLTNLCDGGPKARCFWAMCGLTKILSDWGHQVSGFLHGCPCHDAKERPKKRRRKDLEFLEGEEAKELEESCPMTGRMAVPLAAGYAKFALQSLKSSAATFSPHVQVALQKLFDSDRSEGELLMDNFQTAVSRLTFRMTQSFGYWNELPWSLLMVMQPFVMRFTTAAEARSETMGLGIGLDDE